MTGRQRGGPLRRDFIPSHRPDPRDGLTDTERKAGLLGFNENGTVSSYAPGVTPPGGEAAVVHVEQIWPELPVEDRVLIVRGLVEKAKAARKLAKKRYKGDTPWDKACRKALKQDAAECRRVAKLLCEAWGLGWHG